MSQRRAGREAGRFVVVVVVRVGVVFDIDAAIVAELREGVLLRLRRVYVGDRLALVGDALARDIVTVPVADRDAVPDGEAPGVSETVDDGETRPFRCRRGQRRLDANARSSRAGSSWWWQQQQQQQQQQRQP